MLEVTLEKAIDELKKIKVNHEIIEVSLENCMGKVIAKDIIAPMSQPPFPRSPLDGYAICGEDTLDHDVTKLKVIGHVYAGSVFDGSVKSGEAVRIMTGAPIPKGANAIVKQEDTDYGEEMVEVRVSLKPYDNYCYAGEDIEKDQLLIRAGEVIDYQHVGVLASMGYDKVEVIRPLRVGLICTGDEVVEPGIELKPGKIYNSNRYILSAKLNKLGLDVVYFGDVDDDPVLVAESINKHIHEVDVFLTTGGVSVGVKDIMHDVISTLKAERLFWKVDIQPGTPLLAAIYEDKPLVALSGNPYAAIATFEVVVRPALSEWMQNKSVNPKRVKAYVEGEFKKKCKRRRFVRGIYDQGYVQIPDSNHSSGALYSMLMCNALIDLPKGTQGVYSGDEVTVVLI